MTKASTQSTWSSVVDIVVDDILVPLMGEFTRARQLTSFIHHWYEQLAAFENLRKSIPPDIKHFSAWEDEALRTKLEDLLEASLTTQQIVEVLDWLEKKAGDCEGAAIFVAESIAGSIKQEETIATLAARSYMFVTDVGDYFNLEERYRSRRWRLTSYLLMWSLWQAVDDTSTQVGYPENLLYSPPEYPQIMHLNSLEGLESFRCFCAFWTLGKIDWTSDSVWFILNKKIPPLLKQISKPENRTDGGFALRDEKVGGRIIYTKRSGAWLAFAYAHCILVEFPKVLE